MERFFILVRSPFFIFRGKILEKIFLLFLFFFFCAEETHIKHYWRNCCSMCIRDFSFKSPICWAAWCLSRYPHSSLGYKRGKRRKKKKKRRERERKKKIMRNKKINQLVFPKKWIILSHAGAKSSKENKFASSLFLVFFFFRFAWRMRH